MSARGVQGAARAPSPSWAALQPTSLVLAPLQGAGLGAASGPGRTEDSVPMDRSPERKDRSSHQTVWAAGWSCRCQEGPPSRWAPWGSGPEPLPGPGVHMGWSRPHRDPHALHRRLEGLEKARGWCREVSRLQEPGPGARWVLLALLCGQQLSRRQGEGPPPPTAPVTAPQHLILGPAWCFVCGGGDASREGAPGGVSGVRARGAEAQGRCAVSGLELCRKYTAEPAGPGATGWARGDPAVSSTRSDRGTAAWPARGGPGAPPPTAGRLGRWVRRGAGRGWEFTLIVG